MNILYPTQVVLEVLTEGPTSIPSYSAPVARDLGNEVNPDLELRGGLVVFCLCGRP